MRDIYCSVYFTYEFRATNDLGKALRVGVLLSALRPKALHPAPLQSPVLPVTHHPTDNHAGPATPCIHARRSVGGDAAGAYAAGSALLRPSALPPVFLGLGWPMRLHGSGPGPLAVLLSPRCAASGCTWVNGFWRRCYWAHFSSYLLCSLLAGGVPDRDE